MAQRVEILVQRCEGVNSFKLELHGGVWLVWEISFTFCPYEFSLAPITHHLYVLLGGFFGQFFYDYFSNFKKLYFLDIVVLILKLFLKSLLLFFFEKEVKAKDIYLCKQPRTFYKFRSVKRFFQRFCPQDQVLFFVDQKKGKKTFYTAYENNNYFLRLLSWWGNFREVLTKMVRINHQPRVKQFYIWRERNRFSSIFGGFFGVF